MYNARDIAKYFLFIAEDIEGEWLSNLKLQKLLYYAQGACLAIKGQALFHERIFAWSYGPVVAEVYYDYKEYGSQGIPAPDPVDLPKIDEEIQEILHEVFEVYGQFSAWKLRDITHNEPPWKDTELSDIITHDKIKKYFKTQLKND